MENSDVGRNIVLSPVILTPLLSPSQQMENPIHNPIIFISASNHSKASKHPFWVGNLLKQKACVAESLAEGACQICGVFLLYKQPQNS